MPPKPGTVRVLQAQVVSPEVRRSDSHCRPPDCEGIGDRPACAWPATCALGTYMAAELHLASKVFTWSFCGHACLATKHRSLAEAA